MRDQDCHYSGRSSDDFWTDADIFELRLLVSKYTPAREIAAKLGRSVEAVERKAHEIGFSLKKANEDER